MSLESILFKSWDPLGSVRGKIEDWSSSSIFDKESEVEQEVTAFLKEKFPRLVVRNQFRHDRVIADILVEEKVAIEIKLNLKSTNELNRLLGQIDHYYEWGVYLIVLLVGDCPDDFKSKIQKKLARLWEDDQVCMVLK